MSSCSRPAASIRRSSTSRTIDGPFVVDGAGGPIPFQPFRVRHGRIDALGFRIHDFAYLPDVSEIPDDTWPDLDRPRHLGRRRAPPQAAPDARPSRQSLDWIARAAPRHGVLTNMHNDLDYATLAAELPPNVTPAYDGLELEIAA